MDSAQRAKSKRSTMSEQVQRICATACAVIRL